MNLIEAYQEKWVRLVIKTEAKIDTTNLWMAIYPFRNNIKLRTVGGEVSLECDLKMDDGMYILGVFSKLCEESHTGVYMEITPYFKERRD